ncbi:MAG: hypothetical protein ACKVTZ_22970 [Bacteroidia bacterium]
MHESKLILTLSKFTQLELKRFSEYLNSPFFHIWTDTNDLLTYIMRYADEWKHEGLTKENLFAHLYPNLEYDNKKLNKIISNALDVVENFYCTLYLNKKKVAYKEPLFDFYHKQQLSTHYNSLNKTVTNELEQATVKDANYLHELWKYHTIMEGHKSNAYDRDDISERMDIESFEVFSITQQLMYLCDRAIREYFFNETFSLSLSEGLLCLLKTNTVYLEYPTIKLYYYLYLLLTGEHSYWEDVLALLATIQLSTWEKTNCYGILQNVCIKKGREEGYSKELQAQLIALYKQQVASNCYTDFNGNVAPAFFKNVVTLCLRQKEFDWCLFFMEQCEEKIQAGHKKEIATLCKALWHFEQQLYDETLKLLYLIDTDDVFFNIDKRVLEVRTYYELQEWETTLSYTNALLVYVHRNKNHSMVRKISSQNFAKILKSLISTDKKTLLPRLLEKVNRMPHISEKAWIKKQIEVKIASL